MPSGLWRVAFLGLSLFLLLVGLFLAALIREVGGLYEYWTKHDPDRGLVPGALAPGLVGEDAFGRPVSLARGAKTLLFFLSRGCSACKAVMEIVPVVARLEGPKVVLVVSAKDAGAREYVSGFWREGSFPAVPVIADYGRDLFEGYRAGSVPYAVVVDEEGRVGAQGSAVKLKEVEALLSQAERRLQERIMRRAEAAKAAASEAPSGRA